MEKKHETAADRQRAYRQRQKDRAAQRDMLPLMPRTERADLRAALLEAADALEAAAPKAKQRGRRVFMPGQLDQLHETPAAAAHRKAESIRNLVKTLAL